MVRSTPDYVMEIFADAKQPGYLGILEVVSFLVAIALLVGSFVGAVTVLFAA
jgi:hypothetical protein